MDPAAARLIAACDDPGAVAVHLAAQGARVVRVLGPDAPYALLRASGLSPVRMVPRPGPTPDADALAGDGALSQHGRSLLQQIVDDDGRTPILFTHADAELPQVFATVRELLRTRDLLTRPIHLFDLLHQPRASTRVYNGRQVAALVGWLHGITGDPEARSLAATAGEERTRAAAMAHLRGALRVAAIGAAHALPPEEWRAAVVATTDDRAGEPVFVLGSAAYSTTDASDLAARGWRVLGDDRDWGDPIVAAWNDSPLDLDALADPARATPRSLLPAVDRLAAVAARMAALRTTRVVIVEAPADEATAWDAGYFARELAACGFAVERIAPPPSPALVSARATPPAGRRSRKSLSSIASFAAFQRDWFQGLRARVADGAPFAVVNADTPQEILRAMDVPFVVNQWWASIVAAKQQSRRYFGLLRDHGYPSDAEAYSAQGIAAAFDDDPELAPWGGLPHPTFVQAVIGTEATPRIFDHWARETGADPFLFERSAETRLDFAIDWWDAVADRWDTVLQPQRLDLMVAELREAIGRIEAATDRRFDPARFAAVMDLVNEQEDHYRRTRDLIAASRPAPVSIADTMPATMVPQWHRGTEWARDAAAAFHDEVRARVEAGEAACPTERLRLMWVGRGLWSDMGFYQRWEESHGAVFVWSMYLSLAADGYLRRTDGGRDPMRALAARFVTMGDELRMPTWAGAWHVREAETHGVDGAVALRDADPFVLRALTRAGVPVLSLDLDNTNQEASDAAAIDRQIIAFLDGPAGAAARQRALREGGRQT